MASNHSFYVLPGYLCLQSGSLLFYQKRLKVKINEIIGITKSTVAAGDPAKHAFVDKAFSSDLMSDVLTLDEENVLLISGLANVQLIRTAEMADIHVVILARNKKASPEMVQLANENGLLLLESPFSIFRASGLLFSKGIKPVY